jgi:hypothetical protein
MRLAAQGKKRLRQWLILGAGRPNAKAGDYPTKVHRQQQMDACIPAQAVAPANIPYGKNIRTRHSNSLYLLTSLRGSHGK